LTAGDKAEAVQPPNLLFIFADDQPQSCLGFSGNQTIQTPNLDGLAARGIYFDNAFVTTAICCSNRASILLGQYMRRHGIEDFQKPLSAEAMSASYPVVLREHGYRTGFLGKFAIGRPDPEIEHLSLPKDRFDYWYGFPQSINFLQEEADGPHFLTTRMEEEAVKFLEGQPSDQPFCLTVALKEPHGPTNYFDPTVPDPYTQTTIPPPVTFTRADFESLPDFLKSSLNASSAEERLNMPEQLLKQTRTFYRMISRADLAVGRLLDALKQRGLDKNTVIIYSSDHGSMLGAHGLTGKWLMYEESIRVPMIVYDPRLPASLQGRRIEEMVLTIDIAPTLLELAGVPTPAVMQGHSLKRLLDGSASDWRSDWYYEHTYTSPPVHPIPKSEGVRSADWKYVRYTEFNPPYEQLFDLKNDALEQHDLAHDANFASRLQELRLRCDHYRDGLR
jgi:arylsulfatase A-like enzyme